MLCRGIHDFFFGPAGKRLKQVSAGEGPVAVGGAEGDVEREGGLFDCEAGEIAEFDDLGDGILFGGEFRERFIEGEEVVGGLAVGRVELVEVNSSPVSAGANAAFSAGVFDEDAAHGRGGCAEEMAAALPARFAEGGRWRAAKSAAAPCCNGRE